MFDESEVYPNAPIRLVAFEIRHPFSLRSSRDDAIESFQSGVEGFPILEVEDAAQINLGPLKSKSERIHRLLTRDRRTSITLKPTSMAIESSRYDGYKIFRATISAVLERLREDFQIRGVERLGLRYWDEIRVDGNINEPSDWEDYIASELLYPLKVSGTEPFAEVAAEPSTYQSQIEFRISENHKIRFILGAFPSGRVVHGDGPLTVDPVNTSQPYFLLDIDSFWQTDQFEDFDEESILAHCDQLHGPVRRLFEASITEQLRNQVLREKG